MHSFSLSLQKIRSNLLSATSKCLLAVFCIFALFISASDDLVFVVFKEGGKKKTCSQFFAPRNGFTSEPIQDVSKR